MGYDMAAYDSFTLYYAKSLSENDADDAELYLKSAENNIKLVHCIPARFDKRVTDTSNVQSEDKTSPDTGTALATVQIKFTQERHVSPATPALGILLDMFYKKNNDSDFRFARFGLENTDNPALDVAPTGNGGYKFISFTQVPNDDTPALNTYIVTLDLIGDHTLLGAF